MWCHDSARLKSPNVEEVSMIFIYRACRFHSLRPPESKSQNGTIKRHFFFCCCSKVFRRRKTLQTEISISLFYSFFFFFAYFVVVVEQESVAWPRRRRPFGRRAFP